MLGKEGVIGLVEEEDVIGLGGLRELGLGGIC